jgi:hypothetical protein
VATHSEGGGVEVDSGGMTVLTTGGRRRLRCALRPGSRRQRAPGPVGGGGMTVSRTTEERETV